VAIFSGPLDPNKVRGCDVLPGSGVERWVRMDGGFLFQISSTRTTFFFTAGGTVDKLGLSGRQTGLLVISYGAGASGIAGMFKLEIGSGTGPTAPSDRRSDLKDIAGIFTFKGSAEVRLNLTRSQNDITFTLPPELVAVVPSGFPTTITIPKTAPQINGSTSFTSGTGVWVQAIISGTIGIWDVVTLTGTVGVTFQVGTPSFVRIQGAVATTIRYLGNLSGSIDLGFYTDVPSNATPGTVHPGIIGRVSLALGAGLPGIALSGNLLLEVNLFAGGITQDFQTITFLTCAERPTAANCSVGGNKYQLAQDSNGFIVDAITIRNGLRMLVEGQLTIANLLELQGVFTFEFERNPLVMKLGADASVGIRGLGSFARTTFALRIDTDGVAVYASMGIGGMGGFGGPLGLNFSGTATLAFNTASVDKTVTVGTQSYTVASGFKLTLTGGMDFVHLASANGTVVISLSGTSLLMSIDSDITLGPVSVHATGSAGVYKDASPGIALQVAVNVDFNVLQLIKITGNGDLRLNTTGIQRTLPNGTSIAPSSFSIHIDGNIDILQVISLGASFDLLIGGDRDVTVGSGETLGTMHLGKGDWVFAFSASANFFSIATLGAGGWINSNGFFNLVFDGGVTLGSSSFGLSGNFHFHAQFDQVDTDQGRVYRIRVDFSASVRARIFGITIAGFGINASVFGQGTGSVTLVAHVQVKIDLLIGSITKSADFVIGTIQLPAPFALAGGLYGSDPNIGTAAWSSGTLYINVGQRAKPNTNSHFGGRGVAMDNPNESFTVDHVSGGAGDETVQVAIMGKHQTFSHVSGIWANGDTGSDGIVHNDSFVVHPSVLSGAEIHGGKGNGSLIYHGNGYAKLYGNGGDDYLEVGPSASVTVIMNGGTGSDYILNNSSVDNAEMRGGNGNNIIIGGTGRNGKIYGGSGDDTITSNGVNDTISSGAGNDVINIPMPTVVSNSPTISSTGNAVLILNNPSVASNVRVSKPAGADLQIESLNGSTVAGRVQATGIQEFDLIFGRGPNTAVIDNLDGSSVRLMVVDAGQIVTDTGQKQLVDDPLHPGTKVEKPVLSVSPNNAADTIAISGGPGDDTFRVSGNDPNAGIEVDHTIAGKTWSQQIFVRHTVRAEGDRLIIRGMGGNDTLDASALGIDPGNPSAPPVDLVALTLCGDACNEPAAGPDDDRLIGSLFDDTIYLGLGNKTVVQNGGLYQFFSENPPNSNYTNTLIETRNTDMGLFNDGLVIGTAMNDAGTETYAKDAGKLPKESEMAGTMLNQTNPSFHRPGFGEQWKVGSVIEELKGIFKVAVLNGGDANNTIVVNDVDNRIWINGISRAVIPWTGHAIVDTKGNTDQYPENVVVTLKPDNGALVDVVNSAPGSGVKRLVVFGSRQADNLTLNASGSGAFRVGFIQASGNSTASLSYQGMERVELFTLGGNDNILVNDTAVLTLIDMGSGDNNIVIGTVPLVPDPGNRTLEYPEGVPVADTERMTNGNSASLFVVAGSGNNFYRVNHNRAKLYLGGGGGDNTFQLMTFLVLKENPDNPDEVTNLITLFGGSGNNRYEYLQNAPVMINGGSGSNTLIIVGTPLDDKFIITRTYVAGAGRIVNFRNIQTIQINGEAGNDEFWVLSTDPGVRVIIDGGSGDDTVYLGGAPPPLVYDPPAFTYTPPAYNLAQATDIVYADSVIKLDGFTLRTSLTDWIARGGSIDVSNAAATNAAGRSLAESYAAQVRAALATTPLTQVTTSAIANITARVVWNSRAFWFVPSVEATIGSFQINYRVGHLETRPKSIQPPSVTVKPAPFAFVADPVFDGSQIKGQLIIKGGGGFETKGDTVIYNNQGGVAGTGQLVQRTVPRMAVTGLDAAGKPIYAQATAVDASGKTIKLTDTYLSLEGIGLGIDPAGKTGVRGDTYYGMEMSKIEHLQIRLANGNNQLTINDTAICTGTGAAQTCAQNAPGALPAPELQVYGGSGAATTASSSTGSAPPPGSRAARGTTRSPSSRRPAI
jgi:hypothetical protein